LRETPRRGKKWKGGAAKAGPTFSLSGENQPSEKRIKLKKKKSITGEMRREVKKRKRGNAGEQARMRQSALSSTSEGMKGFAPRSDWPASQLLWKN